MIALNFHYFPIQLPKPVRLFTVRRSARSALKVLDSASSGPNPTFKRVSRDNRPIIVKYLRGTLWHLIGSTVMTLSLGTNPKF